MMERLDKSKKVVVLLYGVIFAIMLICNVLTPYAVDDYSYSFSFATGAPLENILQIFPSMAAHTYSMNGRLTAHFLVQLFMLVPKWVFDIVNSVVFCLQIALICGFCFSEQRSNLRIVAVFCGIWLWELAFGQVNLWQDGAVNYLWSGVILLLFIWPFAERFLRETDLLQGVPKKTGFLVFSFLAGSYSETASAAAVFVVVLLIALDRFCNKRRITGYDIACVGCAAVGYVSIYLAPAQWMNKSAEFSIFALIRNFEDATRVYASFGVLAAAFVVLLVIAVSEKAEIKRVLLGLVLVLGSLAANYIMIFAGYYPERSAVAAFILLMTGVAVLLPAALRSTPWKTVAVSAMAVLMLSSVPALVSGVMDISITYTRMMENENRIHACVEAGDADAQLYMIYPATKYSAIYDAKYLDMEDNSSWPNKAMARYYGIETITGVERMP